MKNNVVTIPHNDVKRSHILSDPLFGIKKMIYVMINENFSKYDDKYEIKINIINNTIDVINHKKMEKTINDIHSRLSLKYGSFQEELPEQKMAIRYLTGDEKILEIGGNIGRNSLVIASLLQDDKKLVTLECDEHIVKQLEENRDINNFHIENSALSKRKLIQRVWDTIPSNELIDGYKWVNTITIDELNEKYQIDFDTLVLDCEGAFYYILMDMPEILNNIKLIIMENDYHDISKKNYVDDVLKNNNFYVDYQEAGGWGPCYNCFFEVWKRE